MGIPNDPLAEEEEKPNHVPNVMDEPEHPHPIPTVMVEPEAENPILRPSHEPQSLAATSVEAPTVTSSTSTSPIVVTEAA